MKQATKTVLSWFGLALKSEVDEWFEEWKKEHEHAKSAAEKFEKEFLEQSQQHDRKVAELRQIHRESNQRLEDKYRAQVQEIMEKAVTIDFQFDMVHNCYCLQLMLSGSMFAGTRREGALEFMAMDTARRVEREILTSKFISKSVENRWKKESTGG